MLTVRVYSPTGKLRQQEFPGFIGPGGIFQLCAGFDGGNSRADDHRSGRVPDNAVDFARIHLGQCGRHGENQGGGHKDRRDDSVSEILKRDNMGPDDPLVLRRLVHARAAGDPHRWFTILPNSCVEEVFTTASQTGSTQSNPSGRKYNESHICRCKDVVKMAGLGQLKRNAIRIWVIGQFWLM